MRYGSSQNSKGWACFESSRQDGQVPAGGLGRRFDLRLVTVADVYDQRRSLDGCPARRCQGQALGLNPGGARSTTWTAFPPM